MAQLPRFIDSQHPSLVNKLHKSLYGLKQAPKAWNEWFTAFLPSLGFQSTYAGSSLFVKHVGDVIVILLLYVDDIIITWSATLAISEIIQALAAKFDIKDLEPLHYFLGIHITQSNDGLFLSQAKYVFDLLKKLKCMNPNHVSFLACFPTGYLKMIKFLIITLNYIEVW